MADAAATTDTPQRNCATRIDLQVDRARVAILFYWIRLWFLLSSWGKNWAKEQAQELQYTIEDGVLQTKQGIWFKSQQRIPLERITDIKLYQGPIMRHFDQWVVLVQTAGGATIAPEASLWGLKSPTETRDLLLKLRKTPAA